MVSKNINEQLNFKSLLIIGPTASGKSALAHRIFSDFSHTIPFEIVNVDAFQIYKKVSAGTAKPNVVEQKQYHYHCLDILAPHAAMDANQYAKIIYSQCSAIYKKGHIPLCVGGSGLYLRAFLHGLDPFPGQNAEIRAKIKAMAAEHGWAYCHAELQKVDPIRANELHPNDKTRIERALELYYLLGKPMSTLRSKTETLGEQKTLFPAFIIHTEPAENILKQKIRERIPSMFAQGWIPEVEQLLLEFGAELRNFNSMKAIGYIEILNFISQKKELNEEYDPFSPPAQLLEKIATLTWQYAKRQMTWNAKEKKDATVTLNTEEEYQNIIQLIQQWLKQNNILK